MAVTSVHRIHVKVQKAGVDKGGQYLAQVLDVPVLAPRGRYEMQFHPKILKYLHFQSFAVHKFKFSLFDSRYFMVQFTFFTSFKIFVKWYHNRRN